MVTPTALSAMAQAIADVMETSAPGHRPARNDSSSSPSFAAELDRAQGRSEPRATGGQTPPDNATVARPNRQATAVEATGPAEAGLAVSSEVEVEVVEGAVLLEAAVEEAPSVPVVLEDVTDTAFLAQLAAAAAATAPDTSSTVPAPVVSTGAPAPEADAEGLAMTAQSQSAVPASAAPVGLPTPAAEVASEVPAAPAAPATPAPAPGREDRGLAAIVAELKQTAPGALGPKVAAEARGHGKPDVASTHQPLLSRIPSVLTQVEETAPAEMAMQLAALRAEVAREHPVAASPVAESPYTDLSASFSFHRGEPVPNAGTPAAPAAAEPLNLAMAAQLQADVVRELRLLQDGKTVHLQIQLDPPSLGAVRVEISSSAGRLEVRLDPVLATTQQALADLAPKLQRDLAQSADGRAVSVSVGTGSSQGHGHGQQQADDRAPLGLGFGVAAQLLARPGLAASLGREGNRALDRQV